MFFNALLAITVSAITYAVALPPQALYVKGTSPGNDEIAGDNVPDTSLLPGFASLPKNDTPPLLHTSPGDRGELLDDAPFAGLCKQVALGGHGEIGQTTLEGKCLDTEKGNWWLTSLNLNRCIGNEGGVMVYQVDGGFDKTCRPCTLDSAIGSDDVMLKCNCLDDDGLARYAELQLGFEVDYSLAVKPVNGKFLCGRMQGLQEPILWR